MSPEKESVQSYEQMLIVEKYETVIAYLYPIAQNLPRRHGTARAMFIDCLLGQVQLIVEAGKSGQISRLYVADAGLAHLRFWLRFLNSKPVRGINFLAYRIWPRHKLLRKRSVVAAKRKIERYQRFCESERLTRFIASWRGHAASADTCHLFTHLENRYGIHCHQHAG